MEAGICSMVVTHTHTPNYLPLLSYLYTFNNNGTNACARACNRTKPPRLGALMLAQRKEPRLLFVSARKLCYTGDLVGWCVLQDFPFRKVFVGGTQPMINISTAIKLIRLGYRRQMNELNARKRRAAQAYAPKGLFFLI